MEALKKILLLEDDEFTRTITEAQLKKSGFEVESFEDLESVLDMKAEVYDLIISDRNIHGIDVEEAILSFRQRADVPLVILSQNDKQGDMADLYLKKPLNADKIEQLSKLISSDDVNIDRVKAFAMGDKQLIRSYIDTFTSTFKSELSLLEKEVLTEDAIVLKNRAHKMLSSVAYYGNKEINSILEKLETEASQMSSKERELAVIQVKNASVKLIESLEKKVLTL
ncbi:response regulator [Fulvivirga ligni]|uniref:response regulator n=1 Tax=Fulvivirga ligni TaxID=2904246 RepID=UPI001F3D1497|nr:response regulator [Fulvivirga ligni]UII22726.1 response regulator [Fulvivirga ligni]